MKSRLASFAVLALVALIAIPLAMFHSGQKDESPGEPQLSSRAAQKKWKKSVRKSARIEERESRGDEPSAMPAEMKIPDESSSLDAWAARYQSLLSSDETRDNAKAIIAEEVGRSFASWVEEELKFLESLDVQERLDRLTLAEESVQEGAAAIYEQLGLEGGRRIEVAKEALEALAAEIQYSQAAPDHKTRVAMLRLDREKELKMNEALALNDESAKTQIMAEIDQWYESGLSGLFPEHPQDQ